MTGTKARSEGMSHLYRQFFPLFGGLFFCHLGIGMSLSTLPFYVRDVLVGNEVAVGVAVTAIALAVVVSRPVAGRYADQYGYKLVMLLGAALCAAAGALYFVALNMPVLVAIRILHGVGEAAVFTAGATWLVQLAPEERRGKAVGLFGVSMWMGITIGAFVGTQILAFGGFAAVWTACLATPVLGLGLIALKDRPQHTAQKKKQSLLSSTAVLPGTALAMGASGYAALAAFVVLYYDGRGIENGIAVFNAYGLAYVGVRIIVGHWPDKFGPKRVAFWSGLVEAVGLLLVALAPNLTVGIAAGLIMGAGLSLLYPSLALMVINRTEKSQQGAALGTYTSFWDLGLLIWGPITGFVAKEAGFASIYFLTMGCAIVASLLVLAASTRSAERPAGSAA
jgi:MFS family permease